jgi:hypothetical protein
MRDADVPARRRIEAAEVLLGFEAPLEAVRHAREYLVAVFEDREQEIADRMDALKLARKFEAPKVASRTIRTTTREEVNRTEAWRAYKIEKRRIEIVLTIMDVPPPGWADDLYSRDYVAPPGWPPASAPPFPAHLISRAKNS